MALKTDSPARRPHCDTAAPAASLPTPAPAPPSGQELALQPAPEPPPAAPQLPATSDAHGFDPAEYQWLPVRRRLRKDGWTIERQRRFIARLADTGCVEQAAMEVSMSVQSCYRLRRAPGAENFAAAWDVALQHAARRLLDVAFDRAFRGSEEPVFDREGRVAGRRFRQNDRLMMFLLRAYLPERFRHANRDWRTPEEPLPPAPDPMEQALLRLAPVKPEDPAALMAPQELKDALESADLGTPGQLPHYLRGRGDAEPAHNPWTPAKEAELERLKLGEAPSDPSLFGPPPPPQRSPDRK